MEKLFCSYLPMVVIGLKKFCSRVGNYL